jgi:hypothetical protein
LRDFQVYIEDIIDAIDSIEEYTGQLTYESFAKDKKIVDAVVRNLVNRTTWWTHSSYRVSGRYSARFFINIGLKSWKGKTRKRS